MTPIKRHSEKHDNLVQNIQNDNLNFVLSLEKRPEKSYLPQIVGLTESEIESCWADDGLETPRQFIKFTDVVFFV